MTYLTPVQHTKEMHLGVNNTPNVNLNLKVNGVLIAFISLRRYNGQN